MAIIKYKCTECKREIDVKENKKGLDIISRCIITNGCRGKLYKIDKKIDFVRGSLPPTVAGLDDWVPRKILYNYTQNIQSNQWKITHNLNTVPSVQVMLEKPALDEENQQEIPCVLQTETSSNFLLFETLDFEVTIINSNELIITFPNPESGIAQLIARTTSLPRIQTIAKETFETFQITNGSIITLASSSNIIPDTSSFNLEIVYTTQDNFTSTTKQYVVGSGLPVVTSPWNDNNIILFEGKKYKVRTFNITIPEFTNGILPDGSFFYFNRILGLGPPQNIGPRNIILLLSLSPYSNIDKIKNKIIDVSEVTNINASSSFFMQNKEMFSSTSIITLTYPEIYNI